MSKSTHTELMTASEVAEAFGRDTRTISRWTREGRLTPTAKLPGQTGAYIYDRAEIERLVATASVARTPNLPADKASA